jgi:hypothetical protein
MDDTAVADQQADWVKVRFKITSVYSCQSPTGFDQLSQAANLSIRVRDHFKPDIGGGEMDQIDVCLDRAVRHPQFGCDSFAVQNRRVASVNYLPIGV